MRHPRRELPERAQLVSTGRALPFFLLLRYVTRNAQHTGGSSFDHKWRVIYPSVSQATIVSEVTHFVCLRFSRERAIEFFSYELAISFINHFQEMATNEFAAMIAESSKGRGIAPLEVTVWINGRSRFCTTSNN